MKMTTAQYEVWENLVREAGDYYNDLVYFLDGIDHVEGNAYYYGQHGVQWLDDTFPEFRSDTRHFVRVWLGDEPIEVED